MFFLSKVTGKSQSKPGGVYPIIIGQSALELTAIFHQPWPRSGHLIRPVKTLSSPLYVVEGVGGGGEKLQPVSQCSVTYLTNRRLCHKDLTPAKMCHVKMQLTLYNRPIQISTSSNLRQ